MNFLPIAINVDGKRILVVGGGNVALQKAKILSQYTSAMTFLALTFLPELVEGFPFCQFIQEAYHKKFLKGHFLVYACTDNQELNQRIACDARKKGILVNVCDMPLASDFVSPAILKEGHISIAVTSNGMDVRQSIAIRNKIRDMFHVGF